MSTYLYCLLMPARPESLPPRLTGVDGAPVRSIASGDVEAWVSTISSTITPDVARARAHNDVVEAAMATGRTPLPARFGQRFADDTACLADVDRRREVVGPALRRVQGTVEMSILLTVEPPVEAPASVELPPVDPRASGAGHRYLAALRAREAAEARWRDRVLEQLRRVEDGLGDLVGDASAPGIGHGRVAGTVSHLVRHAAVDRYRVAAAAVTLAPGFRVLVAGPRAPYSFCDTPDAGAGTILAH